MALGNTQSSFGVAAKTFHWLIATLIIAQFPLALMAERVPLSPAKIQLYATHKSIGLTLAVLMILRLIWRLMNTVPEMPANSKAYERIGARVVHWGFYTVVIVMPVVGWLMSSAANISVSYFGWFTLPNLVGPDRAFSELMAQTHYVLAITLAILFVLHVGAGLKHHFIDKDDVLLRMLPFAGNQRAEGTK